MDWLEVIAVMDTMFYTPGLYFQETFECKYNQMPNWTSWSFNVTSNEVYLPSHLRMHMDRFPNMRSPVGIMRNLV
jgi:hypothetical protein